MKIKILGKSAGAPDPQEVLSRRERLVQSITQLLKNGQVHTRPTVTPNAEPHPDDINVDQSSWKKVLELCKNFTYHDWIYVFDDCAKSLLADEDIQSSTERSLARPEMGWQDLAQGLRTKAASDLHKLEEKTLGEKPDLRALITVKGKRTKAPAKGGDLRGLITQMSRAHEAPSSLEGAKWMINIKKSKFWHESGIHPIDFNDQDSIIENLGLLLASGTLRLNRTTTGHLKAPEPEEILLNDDEWQQVLDIASRVGLDTFEKFMPALADHMVYGELLEDVFYTDGFAKAFISKIAKALDADSRPRPLALKKYNFDYKDETIELSHRIYELLVRGRFKLCDDQASTQSQTRTYLIDQDYWDKILEIAKADSNENYFPLCNALNKVGDRLHREGILGDDEAVWFEEGFVANLAAESLESEPAFEIKPIPKTEI